MKQVISAFLLMFVLGTSAAFAQSTPASTSGIQSSYEAKGINYEQVRSMVQTVTSQSLEIDDAVMADFLRTIALFQAAESPVPMSDEWLNHWTNAYSITNEQAQDLYKVALRFGLQRR